MFQNNLHSDKYKNNTAGQFRPGTEPVPENRANFYTQERQKESNYSYKRHRKQNISLKKTERDANGQSVNAGGNGQYQHGPGSKRTIRFIILIERFHNHLASNENKQTQSNPVVHTGYQRMKPAAQQIAQCRHKRLKTSKVKARF